MTKNYYVLNRERGKIELYFEKDDYMALSTLQKEEVKRNFLFSRKAGCWISRRKYPNIFTPVKIAKDLGLRDGGEIGENLTYEEKVQKKAERAENRADYLDAKAERMQKKSQALKEDWEKASEDWAFVTQPNINTSAGRAFTRQRNRMLDKFERGMEEGIRAAECRERADAIRESAQIMQKIDNAFAQRRVEEAEKALRKIERMKAYYKPDEYQRRKEMQEEKRAYYKAVIEKNGGIPYSRENLKKGDIVKIRRYKDLMVVVSLGPKNAKLKFLEGQTFCLPYPYAEIEQRKEIKDSLADAKVGDIYMWNGTKWLLDRIYTVSDDYAKEHELVYKDRYSAHIVQEPEDYEGIRTIDAAYAI